MKTLYILLLAVIFSCKSNYKPAAAEHVKTNESFIPVDSVVETAAPVDSAAEEKAAKEYADEFAKRLYALKEDKARELRDMLAQNGLNVVTRITGKGNGTLELENILFSDVIYMQLRKNRDLSQSIPLFDRIVITDGNGYRRQLKFQ